MELRDLLENNYSDGNFPETEEERIIKEASAERKDVLEENVLQDLQDAFGIAHHVYMQCVDAENRALTDLAVTEDEKKFLSRHFTEETVAALLSQITDSDPEDVVSMEPEPYLLLRSVAIRNDEGQVIGKWILMGIDGDRIPDDIFVSALIRRTQESALDQALILLSVLSENYVNHKLTVDGLKDTIDKTEESGSHLKVLLQRNEVLTEILKSMEAEEDFSHAMDAVLRETGNYLRLSNCHLLSFNEEKQTVSIVSEWTVNPKNSLIERVVDVPKSEIPFFTGRPYTVSSDSSIPVPFMNFFMRYGMSAGIFLPVTIEGKVTEYACFLSMEGKRSWSIDEIRFLNDVKRIIQAIIVKRITHESLESSHRTLEAILENVGCGVVVSDASKKELLYTNDMFKHMVSTEDELLAMKSVLTGRREAAEKKTEYHDRKNDRWFELTFGEVDWVDGSSALLTTLYDITETKKYQRRMEHQAELDYLTDLYNRKKFEADMRLEIRNANRINAQGAIFYIDLDDFKNINDGLGSTVGDGLLRTVARELQRIGGPKIRVYRVGGDEFALIVPSTENRQLDALSHKIQDAFSSPWQLGGTDYYCTMSMGVVFFPKDGSDVNTLLQRADYALRSAKKSGKNHQEYYSRENEDSQSARRLDMERHLRNAVENDCREFEVYFQPIMDVSGKEKTCIGAEALVRWNSEDFGMLEPGDFIPLAEYLGLILPIGNYVLKEACRRCRYWNDFGHPEYMVHVNLSTVQLMRDNIVDTVRLALEESGINPANLTLEMTESLGEQDPLAMKQVILNLKRMGVRVALDDFGTGYASLAYIRDMPVDAIKIDKSFIDNVGRDAFSDKFVKAVSDLANIKSVSIMVEGVEEEVQTLALKGMNVNLIQGFFYDKPMPQSEFEKKYLL